MWIPKNEAEIVSVVTNGQLQETASLDAKAEISKNTEIAKDIAAMTNDGGVIIYGIGQDQHKRLTILSPFPLANQPERISSIVRSSISEPPTVHIHPIPTVSDPTKGYIIVEIPPSPRAPHMVIVGDKNRYYGRNSSGNHILTEGEVARLYARRQQLEVDRDALLETEIQRYPFAPYPTLAYLYAFVRPVFQQSESLIQRACEEGRSIDETLWILAQSAEKPFIKADYSPKLAAPYQWVPTVDGYRGDSIPNKNNSINELRNFLRLEIDHNGNGHFFCGRAADTIQGNNGNIFIFLPALVAGNVARFLFLFGTLYNKAEYNGMVDVGIAVNGLNGCLPDSQRLIFSYDISPYDQDEYRRTGRFLAHELSANTQAIAENLTMPLIRAIGRGYINPFS